MDFNEINLIVKYAHTISRLASQLKEVDDIPVELYEKYDVKRGLRDKNGKGVLCGLTEISEVTSWAEINGVRTPIPGILRYRGYDVKELIANCEKENRFGFEETVYLLLFGQLPTAVELENFKSMLADFRVLPRNFVRDVIMKQPCKDMMNMLARCVLNLYSYDPDPDNVSISNVLRQSLQLIAEFPMIAAYSHRVYKYYNTNDGSMYIHKPVTEYSTAQNILHILRKDNSFTDLEAKVLDICLILHADHGGGNASTFTTHLSTSTGTDTYSSVAASLGSLKGPLHGGANLMVCQMFENIKENLSDWSRPSVDDYVQKLLDKKAFDRTGRIYGIGHAVYTLSDPRMEVLKEYAGKLAVEKGREKEFELYNSVADAAGRMIAEQRHINKPVTPNVDFYSGFVYSMLNLPQSLYTPFFAIARIAGWSAHRIEELTNGGKIIRPAYQCVQPARDYIPLKDRK
ncbi:MAG: citrate/2-methylcitrate synthase [Clostridiales bacterium]|nr:citrate/2-methylcitrate synthase [Clostridiales bacterium]